MVCFYFRPFFQKTDPHSASIWTLKIIGLHLEMSGMNFWWHSSIEEHINLFLVGGFNPSPKNKSNWIIPQVGVKIKNVWNHHLVISFPSPILPNRTNRLSMLFSRSQLIRWQLRQEGCAPLRFGEKAARFVTRKIIWENTQVLEVSLISSTSNYRKWFLCIKYPNPIIYSKLIKSKYR